MGRFATLDVLEGIYNLRVDTGYWEPSVAKNTVPNLFEYFIGWMATPSTLWAPLSAPTTCALATDMRGASIYLGTRDLANAAATRDETVGKIMTPLL